MTSLPTSLATYKDHNDTVEPILVSDYLFSKAISVKLPLEINVGLVIYLSNY